MNRLTSSLVILLWLAACHHDHGHPGHGDAETSHGSELQLALDGGKKWPVDDHTRASAERLAELAGETVESLDGARALGKALDEELDVLVKGCTMTGQAHDQLHLFLVALIPQVEGLKTATDVGELQRAKGEIDSLLEAYERHFETGDAV